MFDFAKARLEIEDRNRIRLEASLPLLSVADELRRRNQFERESDFQRFFETSSLRKRVEQELLDRIRQVSGNPKWKPTGTLSGGGLAFYNQTRRIMKENFETPSPKSHA